MSTEIHSKIKEIIASDTVVLFMKGVRDQPQCGFSSTVVSILNQYLPDYTTIDVLQDPEIRQGIKDFSSWPTIPQLYVNGEFIGGCDIVKEMEKNGELAKSLGASLPQSTIPIIIISDEAKEAFEDALKDAGEGEVFRLKISPKFEHALSFDSAQKNDLTVVSNGIKITIDPWSAARADGLEISYHDNGMEHGFEIDNPNAPPMVQDISAHDLAVMLENEDDLVLLDARTQAEWDEEHIAQAKLMATMSPAELDALDKDSPIAFICHRGGRSKRAAEDFLSRGFKHVFNVDGGMQGWLSHAEHHHH